MSKTFYIKTRAMGKHPQQWLKEVNDAIHFEFQEFLINVGENCARRMRNIITSNKKRNKGTEGELEKNIESEILNYTGGVAIGIGNILKLPKYWEVINDGGYIPPTTNKLVPLGSFDGERPDSNKSGGLWTVGNDLYTFIDNKSPKKPIEPFMYIDLAGLELQRNIELGLNRLYRKIGVK